MSRFLSIVSSVLSLFVLSWCLGRWFSPPNCINSSLVGKVVMAKSHELVEVCEPMARLFGPALPRELAENRVLERIERLNVAIQAAGLGSGTPFALAITPGSDADVVFMPEGLRVSEGLLHEPGVVERAVLFQSVNASNVLAASIISDFLWQEIVSPQSLREPQLWQSQVQDINGYCLSSARLLVHYAFCQAHNELEDAFISDVGAEPVVWGLANTITQVLRHIYREANISDKQRILEHLIFLGEVDDDFFEDLKSIKTLASQDKTFARVVSDWLMPLLLPQQSIESVVERFLAAPREEITYLVVDRSSRAHFPLYAPMEATSSLIYEYGREKYFFPSPVGLKITRSEIKARENIKHVVYVGCEIPDVSNLLALEDVASRVTYIKQCAAADVDWTAMADEGFTRYLEHNKNVQFIEFNLSALRLAQKIRGPLQEGANLTAWQRWLLWQKVVADEGEDVQRPFAVIDGVRRFRYY